MHSSIRYIDVLKVASIAKTNRRDSFCWLCNANVRRETERSGEIEIGARGKGGVGRGGKA